jgi:hypothetical protein
MMEKTRKAVLAWFAIVAIICWAIIPIRVYILHANDWLVGLLSILGLVFIGAYFILNWKFNSSESAQQGLRASLDHQKYS